MDHFAVFYGKLWVSPWLFTWAFRQSVITRATVTVAAPPVAELVARSVVAEWHGIFRVS